jgi:fumarate hydratase class II
MNMNEVIAARANQILTGKKGGRSPVHPNDHVNMGQSSNDVIPSVIHMAALTLIHSRLVPSLESLQQALAAKSREFKDVKKLGRTHLQDAVPLFLGQEFSGYARQIELGIERIRAAEPRLAELALGGTAVGSGLNSQPDFAKRVIALIAEHTGLPFSEAINHFEAQAAQDAAVQLSGSLKTLAVGLMKIANDIRWLGSGPRLGLGELELPPVQPGSSIMPGKINPVIAESLIMVCAQVIGNDAAITLGGLYSSFQLNTMLPLIARNLLEQITLLGRATDMFTDNLLTGLKANEKHIESLNERSLSLATALAPVIGYDAAAEIAKEAHRTGKNVQEIARQKQILPDQELDRLLDPARQTGQFEEKD